MKRYFLVINDIKVLVFRCIIMHVSNQNNIIGKCNGDFDSYTTMFKLQHAKSNNNNKKNIALV